MTDPPSEDRRERPARADAIQRLRAVASRRGAELKEARAELGRLRNENKRLAAAVGGQTDPGAPAQRAASERTGELREMQRRLAALEREHEQQLRARGALEERLSYQLEQIDELRARLDASG